jgi:hypothetical protein
LTGFLPVKTLYRFYPLRGFMSGRFLSGFRAFSKKIIFPATGIVFPRKSKTRKGLQGRQDPEGLERSLRSAQRMERGGPAAARNPEKPGFRRFQARRV